MRNNFGFLRFLYLNTYAFLLLSGTILLVALPGYKVSVVLYVFQVIVALVLLKTSCQLFSTWPDKKRKYLMLIQRNRKKFAEHTFEIFMKAPCGRLLTKVVLKDLGESNRYRRLKKLYCGSLWKQFLEYFKPQKTTITINQEYIRRFL